MNNIQEAFKYNQARKNVIIGGMVILLAITALSCVSSFMIYKDGFADFPETFQTVLAIFAVIVVEGAFVWLVYGFTRAFSSGMERLVCLAGMAFLVIVMLVNLITHFMMVKGIPLSEFQNGWIAWGAVSVFITVLLIVLFITLADPVIRLVRLELRYKGKQEEKILEAKTQALDNQKLQTAMEERADVEADALATRILDQGRIAHAPAYGQATRSAPRKIGYREEDNRLD
jgi:magnesium-transporting ATPase (P-type)